MTPIEKMIIIMVVGIWFVVMLLLRSCSKMMTSKKEYYDALTKKENEPLDILEKVNITASMMKLIDTLVEIEIDNMVVVYILMKTPYNMLRLDKDIEIVSHKVFEAVKKEMYNDQNLCLEPDYILQFISEQVSHRLIQTMLSTNVQLYVENAENDNS